VQRAISAYTRVFDALWLRRTGTATLTGLQGWAELQTGLVFLGLSAFIGFITSGILAVDEFIRSAPKDRL
jgi:hypothetical protein